MEQAEHVERKLRCRCGGACPPRRKFCCVTCQILASCDEQLHESGASCFLWNGARRNDVPVIRCLIGGKSVAVSPARVMFALHRGEVPAGAEVVNSCNRRGCCQPSHLVLKASPALKGEDVGK